MNKIYYEVPNTSFIENIVLLFIPSQQVITDEGFLIYKDFLKKRYVISFQLFENIYE
jgi:hypothetical protein